MLNTNTITKNGRDSCVTGHLYPSKTILHHGINKNFDGL